MILKMYTVYDEAADAYLPPFYTPTKGLAVRSFTDAVNDPSHQFHKYPASYTLFELGHFNDTDAQFHLHPTPMSIGKAIEFVLKS